MNTTILVILGLVVYLFMYFVYGKKLQNNIIRANKNAPPPSQRLQDGVDYVPANKWVLFGHHFASIAGAGPIVGPAIAMAWGWLPSLIWIWVGNVFIGAVHDYLSLMASVRHDGKSIQWVAGKIMKKRTGVVFEWFVLFVLILVVAAFGAIIGNMFKGDPRLPSSFLFLIIAALIMGRLLYKSALPFSVSSAIGAVLLIVALWLGAKVPIVLNQDPAVNYKMWLLLMGAYIIIASSIPVWVLLQPRDYLNSFLLVAGLVIGGVAFLFGFREIQMPAYTMWSAPVISGKPSPFWPLVPLIIACGSLSGFHALVASGTSSKQLDNETNGLLVGYGTMFTEGFLSTIVVCAIGGFGFAVLGEELTATLTGNAEAFGNGYVKAIGAVGGPAGIFSKSFGLGVNAILGLPVTAMTLLAGMWVSSFALTTLDTTNRLARYTVIELAEPLKEKSPAAYAILSNRWIASLIPAFIGLWLAWTGQWTLLWPAFSGANQMLASIAMITAAVWVTRFLRSSKFYQMAVTIPALLLWLTVSLALVWYLIFAVPTFKGAAMFVIGSMTVVMLALNVMLLFDYFAIKNAPLPAEVKETA
ncbi:carbon starvation protein A [candidate division KSB3 bacterium]|uniref:Carbon starvation protein A n=1 Tax=candidate division KSB3 bacterium TaxID=2044937 RepID=A0A2G6E646_9BACT|nr:MAG: carbon starvation protein A [candidate division KSB3 bacterium]PIE30029.1 MAG: carbon starvation protein A [candidate division KSB3 bacterium]